MPPRLSWTELRLAVRMMRKQLLLTLTSGLALATGIAFATTGYTVMDAVLFNRLPFPNGDRWVLVEAYEEPTAARTSLDVAQLRTLTESVQGLEHVGAISGRDFTILRPSAPPVPVRGTFITPSSFGVLPYVPVIGRTLVASDGVAGAEPVAVIRESLWRRQFGGDPAAIGATANISGTYRAIVGVLPDDSRFPGSGEIWVPLSLTPDVAAQVPSFRVFGVLRSGVAAEAATTEVAALARGFVPATKGATGIRLQVTSFTDAVSRGMDLLTGATTIALVLVLVVIAGNIATLTLARAASRSTELAIRTALGASRSRLIAQIVAEIGVIAVPAAVIGLGASQAFLRWITASADEMPFWITFTLSPRTTVFVVIVTLLAAWIAGVIPGLAATRGNTAGILATARHRPALGRVGAALIALQLTLSIAFLNGAMTMARGVAAYGGQVLAIPGSEVLTAAISFDPAKPRQHRELLDAVRRLPGVRAAGLATSLPRLSPSTERIDIEAGPGEEATIARLAPVVSVTDGFLEALGGQPIAGRAFTSADATGTAAKVVVVNEPFVRRFFNGANPIGRRLRIVPEDATAADAGWREIVGVVPDLGLSAGDVQFAGGVYVPMDARNHIFVAIRADRDAGRLAVPLQQAIASLNPSMQVRHVIGIDEVGLEDRRAFAGIGGAMLAIGVMTLGLSGISLYALLALSVSQRIRETGIRLALGASRLAIVRALMGGATVTLAAGIAGGVGLATVVVQLRWIFAFRLPDGSGPWGPPAIAAVLLLSGLMAAWGPVRRALAIQPADALRQE
jgi:putative ABC transport system permease protein